MVNEENQNNNDLEVLVDIPPTDGEMFANIFSFGKIKIRRPIKMTMREYKDYKSFVGLCLVANIFIGGILFYQTISKELEEKGSLKNIYNYQMEALNKIPSNGIYP